MLFLSFHFIDWRKLAILSCLTALCQIPLIVKAQVLPHTAQIQDERVMHHTSQRYTLFAPSAISPIKLQDRDLCYVQFAQTAWAKEHHFSAISISGDVSTGIYLPEEDVVLFDNLLPQTAYSVILHAEEEYVIGEFNTDFATGNMLSVSETMFSLTANLGFRPSLGREEVFLTVRSANNLSKFEKASFIQRYFLKGKAVTSIDYLLSNSLLEDNPNTKKSLSCDCENVVTSFRTAPGLTNVNSGILQEGNWQVEDDVNKLEYHLRSSGIAKAWRAYSDGGRETRNRLFGGVVGTMGQAITDVGNLGGLPNTFSQQSYIRLNLFCNGGGTLRPCDCEKEVKAKLFYESHLYLRTEVGGGSGTKSAEASAQDIAVAYLLERDGTSSGSFTLIGGFNNAAQLTCNQEPNPAFLQNIEGAISGLLPIAALFFGDTPSGSDIIEEITPELISSLIGLITTPAQLPPTGDCNVYNQTGAHPTIDAEPTFTLTPNQPVEVGIAAQSRLLSTGMRSWQSEAILKSDYFLAIVQPGGEASSTKGDCCTPRTTASYMAKALPTLLLMPDVPYITPLNSQATLQAWVADYIINTSNGNYYDFPTNSTGNVTTPFEWGFAVARRQRPYLSCQLIEVNPTGPIYPGGTIVDGGNFTGEETSNTKGSQRKYSASSSSDKNIVYPSTSFHLDFYTVDGKKLSTEAFDHFDKDNDYSEMELFSKAQQFLQKSSLPKGLYFVRVLNHNTKTVMKTLKVLHQ